MTANITPHLNFRGDARAALEFYRSVADGELAVISYADMGDVQDPAEADQVVWGQVTNDRGFRVMAYDVPSRLPWERGQTSFFVSLRGDSTDEISAYWERLADGATVLAPLAASQWAPLYGMLTDRFGITWVLDVATAYVPS